MRTRVHTLLRWPRMHDLRGLVSQERGSQTAEYVMLGGVAAAACGALIALLRSKTLMGRLLGAAFDALVSFVGAWF